MTESVRADGESCRPVSPLACAFCGHAEPDVALVQGPAVLICNECVDLARADLARRGVPTTTPLEEFPHRCLPSRTCCGECHPL